MNVSAATVPQRHGRLRHRALRRGRPRGARPMVLDGMGRACTAMSERVLVRRAWTTEPGELARCHGRHLAECGINVSYSYSLISTYIALSSAPDLDRAEELLSGEPVRAHVPGRPGCATELRRSQRGSGAAMADMTDEGRERWPRRCGAATSPTCPSTTPTSSAPRRERIRAHPAGEAPSRR